jgi:hypothetical protein
MRGFYRRHHTGRYFSMIERIGSNPAVYETQTVEEQTVAPTPTGTGSSHIEVSIHGSGKTGEMQWLGAMNAYKAAQALEAHMPKTISPAPAANDPMINKTDTIPNGVFLAESTISPTNALNDPVLIPFVAGMDQDRQALKEGRNGLVLAEPGLKAETSSPDNSEEVDDSKPGGFGAEPEITRNYSNFHATFRRASR